MLKRAAMVPLVWMLGFSMLGWTAASAQQRYGWTVSGSSTDPCVSTGNFVVGGLATLFLWYFYNDPDGMSAADLSVDIQPPGAVSVLAFNTANGYLNAGSATNPLLAVGGCPNGPLNAGSWLMIPVAPAWQFCLGGNKLTVDCQINPIAWPSDVKGFANGGGSVTCVEGMPENCSDEACFGWFCDSETGECYVDLCACGHCDGPEICAECQVVSVETSSWGKVKTLYR